MRQTQIMTAVASLLAVSLSGNVFAAADIASTNTGLSQLLDARGLSDPVYRWNAKLVWPAQPPKPEDIRDFKETAWTFDDGTTAGITRFSGVENARVENGILKFTTADKGYFYWGDHFDDENVAGLNLDFPPPDFKYRGKQGWTTRLRVRQTLPESHWIVAARRAGAPADLPRESFVLKGTNWQEASVLFTVRLGLSNPGPRFHSLCFEPGEPGNRIEIDWVRVGERKQACGLRKILPEFCT